MAVKMVKSLCANLNAVDGIVSVKQRIDELEQHTPAPDEGTDLYVTYFSSLQ